jgi:hypothetical protein
MDFAKKLLLLFAVSIVCLTGIAAAADRMVVCEYVTNWG